MAAHPAPSSVEVAVAEKATPELVEAFARLVPQLSSSSPPPTLDELERVVSCDTNSVLVATDAESGDVLGTLTLVVFPIPTGIRAWIEDVVVDAGARGRGVGEALNREALRLASALGAKTVDLTSRPSREAANRLYLRIGFNARATNVYRYDLM